VALLYTYFFQCRESSAVSCQQVQQTPQKRRTAPVVNVIVCYKAEYKKYSVMQSAFMQRYSTNGGWGEGLIRERVANERRPLTIERSFGIRLGIQNALHFLPANGSKNSPTLHRPG